MKAAVYNGIMSNGTILPPQVTCATGNCTWPITPSLAVCGQCHEATYQKTCNNENCTFTFDAGVSIILTNLDTQGEGTCWNSTPSNLVGIQKDNTFILSEFYVVGMPYASIIEYGFHDVTSHRCTLEWCVNAYSRTSISGNQTESIVATESTWQQIGSESSSNITTLPASFNPTPGEVYSLTGFYPLVVSNLLTTLLSSYAQCGDDSAAGNFRSSDAADAIWYYTARDPHAWIRNLATSISNVVRTSGASALEGADPAPPGPDDPLFRPYHGTAYQLGIQIRWAWITLPAATVAVSLAMLIYEMISTARSHVYPWKASPLALLLTEVEPSIRQQVHMEDMTEHNGLTRRIGRKRAVLEWGPTGMLRVTGTDIDRG